MSMKQFIIFIFITAFLISCSEKKSITVKELRLLEQKISIHNFKVSKEYQTCRGLLNQSKSIMCGTMAGILIRKLNKYHHDIQWTGYDIRYDTVVTLEKWLTWCETNHRDPLKILGSF